MAESPEFAEPREGDTLVAVPRPVVPFVTFGGLLRANGFAVAPEQTQAFVAAVGLLGPRRMGDVYRAATATLAPSPDRMEAFDALFRAHFYGQSLAAPADTVDEERAFEPEDGAADLVEPEEVNEAGADASGAEALAARSFAPIADSDALRHFRRTAPEALPKRRSRRFKADRHGSHPDLRRSLRDAVRHDGELIHWRTESPRRRQRRIVCLIDVSGSMKSETDRSLRFAHALVGASERCEVFTLGTRLTRITSALRRRNVTAALEAASASVRDWDGGTRLGDALAAYLEVPRYAGFARSSFVIVLSDGLERGDPQTLVNAVDRLSRLAWQILWLTPLASDRRFTPATEAMASIAPKVARIGPGASTAAVVREVLALSREARG
ncbi:MAG: VWA domain-containing protein [Pseudomonadota bacterium]